MCVCVCDMMGRWEYEKKRKGERRKKKQRKKENENENESRSIEERRRNRKHVQYRSIFLFKFYLVFGVTLYNSSAKQQLIKVMCIYNWGLFPSLSSAINAR